MYRVDHKLIFRRSKFEAKTKEKDDDSHMLKCLNKQHVQMKVGNRRVLEFVVEVGCCGRCMVVDDGWCWKQLCGATRRGDFLKSENTKK